MAEITLKGSLCHTVGDLPATGSIAPDFTLTGKDLKDVGLADFKGKRVIMNIFPSIDTPVCATSVRRFNSEINKLKDAVCLCISRDLPFAHDRFCGTAGLERVVSLSELRSQDFGDSYGLRIATGPLAGLLARAVLVLDQESKVIHGELVPEISQEPDYAAALAAVA
jgi:thiol peroxidase